MVEQAKARLASWWSPEMEWRQQVKMSRYFHYLEQTLLVEKGVDEGSRLIPL